MKVKSWILLILLSVANVSFVFAQAGQNAPAKPADVSSQEIYTGPEVANETTTDEALGPEYAQFEGMTTNELVLKLLDVNGMHANLQKNRETILAELPADKRAQVEAAMNPEEIIQALVPVYEKYFTAGDLKRLIVFYQSPLGKKLIEVTPSIMKETVDVTSAYFAQKLKK
jgi:hypothetical protein